MEKSTFWEANCRSSD